MRVRPSASLSRITSYNVCYTKLLRDGEEEVFTGLIDRVEQGLTGVSIEILAATLPLSSWYGAQTYQDQTVADIIGDLAGQAGRNNFV